MTSSRSPTTTSDSGSWTARAGSRRVRFASCSRRRARPARRSRLCEPFAVSASARSRNTLTPANHSGAGVAQRVGELVDGEFLLIRCQHDTDEQPIGESVVVLAVVAADPLREGDHVVEVLLVFDEEHEEVPARWAPCRARRSVAARCMDRAGDANCVRGGLRSVQDPQVRQQEVPGPAGTFVEAAALHVDPRRGSQRHAPVPEAAGSSHHARLAKRSGDRVRPHRRPDQGSSEARSVRARGHGDERRTSRCNATSR